jgi:hypothetical protein
MRDAAEYIQELSEADQQLEEWQNAVAALLLVVEHNGPTMMARIGVMRALNRHVERVFDPTRKDHHWGRRKLKRDQIRLRQYQQTGRRPRPCQGVCAANPWTLPGIGSGILPTEAPEIAVNRDVEVRECRSANAVSQIGAMEIRLCFQYSLRLSLTH